MHLAALHIYPVKSLRGLAVPSVGMDALGAVGDRRFLVVDPQGVFITQRSVARMAQVGAAIDASALALFADGHGSLRVRREPDPGARLVAVRVWKSDGLRAEDCGDEAASWLSGALGTPCRLVRIGPAFSRPVKPAAARPGDLVGFADAFPVLATSEASLGELNRRIGQAGAAAVPMDRFRPNLVIAGCKPFEEDSWRRIRVGPIVFRAGGPCIRCLITTTDQLTGARGAEPLRTLATFRRDPDDPTSVWFGQNLVHESKAGALSVGDPVVVIE
jgi:uncharacterized protein YcbX